MNEKTKLGDIRKDIKKNKETAEEHAMVESHWTVYDSPLFSIGSSFSKVIPEEYVGPLNKKIYTNIEEFGDAFKAYIENTLSKNGNKEKTAIEFGGSGSQLFSGFTKNFFKKTAGVCLDDVRKYYTKTFDNQSGHSVIIGNITDTTNKDLYNKISKSLGTKKVDLIISRMMGPLDEIRKNPALLDKIIRKWYSMLNEKGILFAQFEYFTEHDPVMRQKYEAEISPPPTRQSEKYVGQWMEEIKKKFPNEIEVQLGRGIIRLLKKDGAPESLPSSKELFEI